MQLQNNDIKQFNLGYRELGTPLKLKINFSFQVWIQLYYTNLSLFSLQFNMQFHSHMYI